MCLLVFMIFANDRSYIILFGESVDMLTVEGLQIFVLPFFAVLLFCHWFTRSLKQIRNIL